MEWCKIGFPRLKCSLVWSEGTRRRRGTLQAGHSWNAFASWLMWTTLKWSRRPGLCAQPGSEQPRLRCCFGPTSALQLSLCSLSSALLGTWHSFSFCSSAEGWELPELPLPLPSPDSALAGAQAWAEPWHSHLRCSLAVPTGIPAQTSEPCSLCSSWTVFASNPGVFIALE